MKVNSRSWLAVLLLATSLCFLPVTAARALNDSPAATSSTSPAPQKQETDESNEQFRHAPIVQLISRVLHVDVETTAQIFEDINSAALILLIGYFLFRFVPKAFRSRSETIQKQLIEARAATEEANGRLAAVEARLARLGEDIDAIRQQTERDIVEDEKRIKQSLDDEKQRIVKSVEQEIESAGAAAQRQLKQFAAELSIDRAVKRIQLTAESDKAIVARFGEELASKFGGNGGRN